MADAGLISRAEQLEAKALEIDAQIRAASGTLSETDIAHMEAGVQTLQNKAEWYRKIAEMEPERAKKFIWVMGGGFLDNPEFWPKEYRPTQEQIDASNAKLNAIMAKLRK